MNFSELIGKKIISLYDKKVVGVVISANFNKAKNKITSFIVEDNQDGMFDELSLSVKDIYSSSFDAIVIKNSYCLKNLQEKTEFNPINYEVYTICGKKVGKVKDVVLDEKFIIKGLMVDNNVINYSNIAGVDNGIIIIQEEGKFVDIHKFKHKDKKIKIESSALDEDFKAVILPMYDIQENSNEQTNTSEVKIVNNVVQKSFGINHLLGKTATQNIVAPNGELVCRVGGIVTQDVINKANAYSKLRELSFYVK